MRTFAPSGELLFHLAEEVASVESWQVAWRDERDQEQRKEFGTYLEAWDFNEQALKGKGLVTLLTDRELVSERSYRNEAAAARQVEGAPRRYAKKK